MPSNFATAMVDTAKTWNGATSLSTPDISGKASGRLGLYFKSVRGLNAPRLYEYLREAAKENTVDTFLLVFHIRDCRGGKGERDLGRRALVWLFLSYPNQFSCITPLIAEYGRWDDLLQLWPGVLELNDLTYVNRNWCVNVESEVALSKLREFQKSFVQIMARQLVNDRVQMESGNPISICAKWAPTEKDSLDRTHKTVQTLCKAMNISPRAYRKQYITQLRQYLKIVERFMCENNWDKIDFSKVPSCAMKRLKNTFENHTPETFEEWKQKLRKGDVTINAKQLYPHELVYEIRVKSTADIVTEEQWKVLEKEMNNLGVLRDTLCVCDVSYSMETWGPNISGKKPNFYPKDAAIALSLLVANTVQGPFHNHIITFHSYPSFHVVKDGSLYDRWSKLVKAEWGGSTNLQATFDLILDQAIKHNLKAEDMPKRIIIFSDMQFNEANGGYISKETNFEIINKKYKNSGYIRPQIVFWNLVGSSTDFPVSVTDNGTALISGFSTNIMKAIMQGKECSPYSIMRDTLDNERYDPIRKAFS